MDNQHYCFEQDTLWNRVWKINRTEIDNHINNWWKSNYQPLKEIAEWPGNGDTLLGQAAQLAPFFDRNHDGKYIPKDGDYPLIKGDQAIYFIFNDDRNIHTASGGNKLGIEIHGLAYAFNCEAQAELYNTFFIDYKIFNRSTGTYYDTYLGIFTDFDLGWGQDDHLASDVPTSSLIVYNGDPEDGFDNPGSYGLHPPAQSVSLLSGPLMDADGFDNTASGPDGSPLCNEGINGEGFGDGIIDNEKYGMTGSMAFPPFYWFYFYQNPEEIYNHFLGLWRDGSSMLYGGTGMYEENAYGPSCRFIFPGISDSLFWGTGCNPPNGPANWTMQTAGIEPGDVSGMISSGPWTFFPGESVEISLAYIYARQDDPSINQTSLELLINDIQKVKSAYRNESLQCGPGPSNLNKHYSATPNIRLYPNPTEDKVHIILPPKTNQAHYQLFTAMGNLVENDKIIGNEATIDLTKQKSGFYTIQIQTTSQTWISKIIKI